MIPSHALCNRCSGLQNRYHCGILSSSFDKTVSESLIVFWQDLCSIGITTLGPRKKILHALRELRSELTRTVEPNNDDSKSVAHETKLGTNKLITDYFSGPLSERKRGGIATNGQSNARRSQANITHRSIERKHHFRNGKQKDVPLWCCIPGTPFRVVNFAFNMINTAIFWLSIITNFIIMWLILLQ